MIEFLPPRRDAFGGDHDPDVADDAWNEPPWDGDDRPARSRWLGVLAAVGVGALITAGVLAASPWSSDGSSSPPTTAGTASEITGNSAGSNLNSKGSLTASGNCACTAPILSRTS